MIRRAGAIVVVVTGTALAASLSLYLAGGSKIYERHRAPDGRGAVELVTPTRWQALRSKDFEVPVAARFVDVDGSIVGSTPVFDLTNNATIHWDKTGVSVGSAASYDRRTRRWAADD